MSEHLGSPAVEELLAKQAITEQIHLYCRAMDRIDRELGKTVWHPDGVADYGSIFQGTGAEFIEWVSEGHSQMLGHSHQVANIVITVTGETATSEAYVCAALRQRRDGQVVQATIRGRYLDRWSRRGGRWAIDRRTYVHDFDDVREITEQRIEPWGRRDRGDPVYAL
jgi:hypothetical protein